MPIVEVHLLEGYSAQEKQRLGNALTDAVRFVIPAAPEAITVLMHELGHDAYMRGGVQRRPAPANADPTTIVRDYLAAMEKRDLATASAMLGDGFTMQFPATGPMTRIEELIEWSKTRYRSVRKTYDRFDAMPGDEEAAIVYCCGNLSGEWLDGSLFEGIRFIDRFELVNGLIVRQDVWNDMGEVRLQA